MLVDASPAHPMCFYLECDVEGPLEESRLRRALADAAVRHPLVRSRVARRGWRSHWLEPDVAPQLLWKPPAGERPWAPPDLATGSGVRLVVLDGPGPERHRVILQVQHAVCDGLAALEFLGDLWAHYAGLEPAPFRASSRTGTVEPPVAATTGADMRRDTLAFARFRPQPLVPLRGPLADAAVSPTCEPPYVVRVFDRDVATRLRLGATGRGIALNDLVIAGVMRAAIAWNERVAGAAGSVRINVPISLRPPGTRQPARNVLGYAFLDRRPEECREREPLAASLAAATRWILDTNAAAEFPAALRACNRVPGLVRLLTRVPLCHATGVVSNIGEASRRMRSGVAKIGGLDAPGGLLIHGVWGVPPLRPRTRVALGISTYGGVLVLCCTCSAGPDRQDAARRFLDLVQPELEAFAT